MSKHTAILNEPQFFNFVTLLRAVRKINNGALIKAGENE